MAARFLVSNPCQDACGVMETDEFVEGARVYACPGCDTRWIELNERKPQQAEETKKLGDPENDSRQ